jgi:hypothetical protein
MRHVNIIMSAATNILVLKIEIYPILAKLGDEYSTTCVK